MMGDNLPVNFSTLQEFCNLHQDERIWREEFTPILQHTANTSELLYPWEIYREIIKARLLYIVTKENETAISNGISLNVDDIKRRLSLIGEGFHALESAPFTVQRLCELVVNPSSGQHRSIQKYLRAVDKVLCVSPVFDTLSFSDQHSDKNGCVNYISQ